MEELFCFGLLFFIWLVAVLVHPSFRQGWRNSKFWDQQKKQDLKDEDVKDMVKP